MAKPKDHTGKRFGRLTVLRLVETGPRKWLCACDCGNETAVFASNLTRGNTTSCGCYHREVTGTVNQSHGATRGAKKSPEYRAWRHMKTRCYNPNYSLYHRYGGRGITICDRWRDSFENFLADMGPRPSPQHSLDRVNNDGDYTPDNCRWATARQQAHSMLGVKHWNSKLTKAEVRAIRDSAKPPAQLAREYGVSLSAILDAINRKTWRHVA